MSFKTVAKHYFSHPSVWVYILIGAIVLFFCVQNGYFYNHYYVILLPIVIAPYFEWFAHKYILHAQIGNVIEIEKSKYPEAQLGDKFIINFHNKSIEMEVLKIRENVISMGYGWAKKMPYFRRFMHVLHYGHHQDPNNIALIFAPILSVFILFGTLFGITLLITFSCSIACVFLLGIILYYLHYEWMHLGHHIPGYNHFFGWSKKLKTAHQLHHYRNENYWWGITNMLGDKVFGTYKKHDEVSKSETIKNINL